MRSSKRFGETLAVDNLSFRVEPARVTGFLGPNGAGKTTTMRAVLGLVRPTSGTATVLGRPYREPRRAGAPGRRRARGDRVPPGPLRPQPPARRSRPRPAIPGARVDEVLELVELTDAARRRAGGYSLGMRQRLALAAALLGDPEVLVLDEPANGLDPAGVRWLRDLLRAARRAEGRTILVSSHILSEVEVIADEVVIIHRGKFVASGTIQELVARASGGVRVRSPEASRLRELLARAGRDGRRARGRARRRRT